jgi:DNA-directed RNA polymerase specialized sigma24 family protein
MRQVQTVSVANENELLAVPDARPPAAMAFEFGDWMNYLEPLERETMVLRFVEEWEYHEIAAEQAVPIGTVQWRVFNSKKKLAARLNPCRDEGRRAA